MSEVQWPWQYNFPPFFTLQPNEETKKKQLEAWRDLVLEYVKKTKTCIVDVQEADTTPLFSNAAISRKLSLEGIQAVLEMLHQKGNAEPIDKTKVRWYIYWHTLAEWADIFYQHAQENGLVNSVCTLYELVNTPDKEFTGLNEEIVIKILAQLQKDGKAELILSDDGSGSGVKFF
uniref:Vacuolar protein-sorting-associated protein 25 n=1 Tax=Cacopsylla melanoneura TaxID=428564 RepID=A0A8D9BIX8_9HEMI